MWVLLGAGGGGRIEGRWFKGWKEDGKVLGRGFVGGY